MKYLLTRVITTMGILIVLSSTQVSAESNQKIEQVSCQTMLECEQLSQSLGSQINVFKNRGMANLSRAEKIEYLSLKKQLLSTQREITATQEKILAEEKKKTAAMHSELLDTVGSIKETLKKP